MMPVTRTRRHACVRRGAMETIEHMRPTRPAPPTEPSCRDDADALARRDLEVVWNPCTQKQDQEWLPMIPIRRGLGVWLEGLDGRRYLDAISSWWVNLFGHAHPRIG